MPHLRARWCEVYGVGLANPILGAGVGAGVLSALSVAAPPVQVERLQKPYLLVGVLIQHLRRVAPQSYVVQMCLGVRGYSLPVQDLGFGFWI